MWINFENTDAATDKLKSDGFRLLSNGFWFKAGVKASIHPVWGIGAAVVCYQSI